MRATKETTAGRKYLELQREARRTNRPTDELIQFYALECFLDRLARSEFSANFVLKGGVLLAALNARRPTRDIDFSARAIDNDTDAVLRLVRRIAAVSLDDGMEFHAADATAETIRDEEEYSGVRVTLSGTLSRASVRLHVDVNVGDPIWPEPQDITLTRLLDGKLSVRGYPLEMVLAEKIVTAIARGTASTRWRDFVDIYSLVQRHAVDGPTMKESMRIVARHRDVTPSPLETVLEGYEAIAQSRWLAWLRKQRLETVIPNEFAEVLRTVEMFSDPVISGAAIQSWNPATCQWS
ncbi:MAG: nucleotidyl transferase AbiEii/AbiGii toxin family protein [Proteobacteria bacterium]|nr:nucleotidyl transferase AbiEii/AbiGii toxin family protein [Pseudomonadota bacterium]